MPVWQQAVSFVGCVPGGAGGGGTWGYISLGEEVRPGPSYPDPVKTKSLIFLPCLRQNTDF